MTRITFVSTKKNLDHTERELYEMDLVLRVMGLKRAFLDLGPLTVAACTPPGVDIDFVDEYVDPINFDVKTDVVALSAKTSCATYAYEVARRFRERGQKVILGGIHASLRPNEALEHVDCVVTGEAEAIWPTVVRDIQQGKLGPRYDAPDFPNMSEIPTPRWQGSPHGRYLFHQVQTTRGCPFRCRFCSVPDISGNAFRFKPVDRVVQELASLPKTRNPITAGRPLYFVDDNFISRTRYTKDLLRAMAPLHASGKIPSWSAETTLNVAQDEELLDLFAQAGCSTLIIGFESVGQASLDAMDKPVNYCLTYQEAVERIHARNITVVGNFIVGFDTDTRSVFKDTIDFVQRTGILYPFFSILTPMPGTKLFDEYKAAGRLDHERWELYDTRHVVFEPAHMTRDELMDGYVWLYEQAYGGDKLVERLESSWKNRPPRATLLEKSFVAARLAGEVLRGDSELRRLYADSFSLMYSKHLGADPGELLFVLDAYDFARFLRRFSTPNRAKNYRTFEHPEAAAATEEETLRARQWENEKAKLRTQNRPRRPGQLPVVA